MKEIVVRKYYLDGIPLSTYEIEDNIKKPLIFSFHGFTGYRDGDYFKREDQLAKLGFFVVGFDSILHGERRIEVFEKLTYAEKMKNINDVIIQSALDAIKLYEKYFVNYNNILKNQVYAMGVSMGGAISIYLATQMKLNAAVSIVGSPSMVEFLKEKKETYLWDNDFYFKRNLEYLKDHDPVLNKEKLVHTPLFLTGGLQDEIINYRFPQMLENYGKVRFKIYDTPHMPNQQQFDDAYNFLVDIKKENNHD